MVAHRIFNEARGLRAGQPVLGLALELRVADEDRKHQLGFVEDIIGGDLRRLLIPHQLAKGTQPLGQRGAHARLMGAAIGGRDGVAIPAIAAIRIERPSHRPFDTALIVGEGLVAVEEFAGDAVAAAKLFLQVIGKPAGELENRLLRHILARQLRIAFPADFNAGEKIGLRPRQAEQARGFELRIRPENFRIGREGDGGATPVGGRAKLFKAAQGCPARETLAVKLLVARNLDDRVG